MTISSVDIPSVDILGAKVDGPTASQAVEIIIEQVRNPDKKCRHIVVTGFHGLWIGHQDEEFLRFLNEAELFCPDGIAPIWLARLQGRALQGRVTGAELMEAVLHRCAREGIRSFFYGDSENTLTALAKWTAERFPGAEMAGSLSPPFRPLSDDEERAHVDIINASGADILWVGLGLPKQERWIARNRLRLRVPVAIGVGAAFRFSAGLVSRPPRWMGENGLEWVWRLCTEPAKVWRRVFIDGPQFWIVALAEVWRKRKSRGV